MKFKIVRVSALYISDYMMGNGESDALAGIAAIGSLSLQLWSGNPSKDGKVPRRIVLS